MSARASRPRSGCFGRLLLLLLCALLIAGAALFLRYQRFQEAPATPDGDPITFTVDAGATPAFVISKLNADGRLRRSAFWPLLIREHQTARCIKRGEHTLASNASSLDFLRLLCTNGGSKGDTFTVPEGWTRFHLARAMAAAGMGRTGDLTRATGNEGEAALRTFDGVLRDSAEGLLFPDTYAISPDQPRKTLITRMRNRFDEVWAEEATPERLADLKKRYGVTPYDILTLASLVEREAIVADERPRIAQVFYNRIITRMRMQSDPTCAYGPTTFDKQPTATMCRDKASRFSTYLLPGLPPTPIAAVGRSSLRAALNPSGESDIFYFVAIADGSHRHRFAATLDDHNRNVRDYIDRSRQP
jgi:UPF0755 protein